MMQARADTPDLLERVQSLMRHPDFTMKTPNRLRAAVAPFLRSPHFHNANGDGYRFAAGLIQDVDAINPQIAARLAGLAFQPWRRLDSSRKELVEQQLDFLLSCQLSKDTSEILTKVRG